MVQECGSPLPLLLGTGRERTRHLVPHRGSRDESARGLRHSRTLPRSSTTGRKAPKPMDTERSRSAAVLCRSRWERDAKEHDARSRVGLASRERERTRALQDAVALIPRSFLTTVCGKCTVFGSGRELVYFGDGSSKDALAACPHARALTGWGLLCYRGNSSQSTSVLWCGTAQLSAVELALRRVGIRMASGGLGGVLESLPFCSPVTTGKVRCGEPLCADTNIPCEDSRLVERGGSAARATCVVQLLGYPAQRFEVVLCSTELRASKRCETRTRCSGKSVSLVFRGVV